MVSWSITPWILNRFSLENLVSISGCELWSMIDLMCDNCRETHPVIIQCIIIILLLSYYHPYAHHTTPDPRSIVLLSGYSKALPEYFHHETQLHFDNVALACHSANKETFGWKGFIFSDCMCLKDLRTFHAKWKKPYFKRFSATKLIMWII